MSFSQSGLDILGGGMEGGSAGVGLMAALKTAGITGAAAYAPWLVGGMAGANVLGKFMGRAADAPAERMQFRLGDQQLELNSLDIEAKKRMAAEERATLRKRKAMQSTLSKVFGAYQQLKGGTP
jgi:hypothetical protein